jgi:hypothetical protein
MVRRAHLLPVAAAKERWIEGMHPKTDTLLSICLAQLYL